MREQIRILKLWEVAGGERGDEEREREGSWREKIREEERRRRESFLCASQKLSRKGGIISAFFPYLKTSNSCHYSCHCQMTLGDECSL